MAGGINHFINTAAVEPALARSAALSPLIPQPFPVLFYGDTKTHNWFFHNAGTIEAFSGSGSYTLRVTLGDTGAGPFGGTYTLVCGTSTSALAYNATAAQIQTALNLLATVISEGGVTVTGNFPNFIVFNNALGAVTSISGTANLLNPDSQNTVTILTTGDATHRQATQVSLRANPIAQQSAWTQTTTPSLGWTGTLATNTTGGAALLASEGEDIGGYLQAQTLINAEVIDGSGNVVAFYEAICYLRGKNTSIASGSPVLIQGTVLANPTTGVLISPTNFFTGNSIAMNPMTTLGDIIYGGTAGAEARLAGNITAAKQFLSQTGNGAVSAAPAWAALVNGDIPSALTGKTYNGLTLTSTTGTLTLAAAKVLTVSNTLTFAGTDSSTLNIGTGGTLGTAAFTAASAYAASGLATGSGLTMNTAKILGRATAGVGAIEEIAVTGSGSVVLATAPAIVGGTHTAITSLGIRSTGAAFDLTLASAEVLTAGRTLTFNLGDAARTLTLSGNPTLSGFTATGTGTLALGTKTLTVSNTLTFTGTDSSSVAFGAGGTVLYSGGSYVASITGTAGQVTASAATGAVTLSLPTALTGINSVTSVALSALILATGTSGTALTIASATNIATFGATTAATNSLTGSVLVGNGSSLTNVGIGGGNVYAGGNLLTITGILYFGSAAAGADQIFQNTVGGMQFRSTRATGQAAVWYLNNLGVGEVDFSMGNSASGSPWQWQIAEASTSMGFAKGGGQLLTLTSGGNLSTAGTIAPQSHATSGGPAYVEGQIYYDTTLHKLRVGGAAGWETITSV